MRGTSCGAGRHKAGTAGCKISGRFQPRDWTWRILELSKCGLINSHNSNPATSRCIAWESLPLQIPAIRLNPIFVIVLPSPSIPLPSSLSPWLRANSVNTFPKSLVGLTILLHVFLITGRSIELTIDCFGMNGWISGCAAGSMPAGRKEYGRKFGFDLWSAKSAASAWPLILPKKGVNIPGVVVVPSPDT